MKKTGEFYGLFSWLGGCTFIIIFCFCFILMELCSFHNCSMIIVCWLLINLLFFFLNSTINLAKFVSKWKILTALVVCTFTIYYLIQPSLCLKLKILKVNLNVMFSDKNHHIFFEGIVLEMIFLKGSTVGFIFWEVKIISLGSKIVIQYIWDSRI